MEYSKAGESTDVKREELGNQIIERQRREMETMKGSAYSEIRSGIEELSKLQVKATPCGDDHHKAAHFPTMPFLHLSNLLIQVLDKIGPTMAVLRQDIQQNIQRLEIIYEGDPSKYSNVVEILEKEMCEGNSRKRTSSSKAFVWLTRSMDFSIALLQKLVKDPQKNMVQAVEESYSTTLKPWHGWISSAAYKVALKLLPDNKTFINLLMAKEII
ncbi:glycolipid transfer protein 3 isoform X2 [Malania oleifera]|uniref:glycolipid transfer protein 3 isoform X2 n=1 Tax=Malania oleifera TaxID=397392 RepID=UPI0025AE1BB7|nr:glycolipid transfer protein 3 isoform X2 [Malania oleifera]